MPDRVKLPRNIPRVYQITHKQIIDQQNPATIAPYALKAVKKDIKKYGKGATNLVSKIADYIKPVQQDSLLRRIPDCWDDVHQKIDLLALEADGNREFIALAADAGYQIALRLEYGEQINDIQYEIDKQFKLNVWNARCGERILAQDTVSNKGELYQIEQVSEFLHQEIENSTYGVGPIHPDDLLDKDILGDDF